MNMVTDHAFHIGEQHLRNGKPCQDYALSGMLTENLSFAIISDGCSSGGMTDIGSRLMTLATRQALIDNITDGSPPDVDLVHAARDAYLEMYRRSLGLNTNDMLATCIWAIANNDWVIANVTGDGVVVVKCQYDHIVHQFNWDKNMPYYPAYRIGGLDQSFMESMESNSEPLTYIEEGLAPTGMGGCRDGNLRTLSVDIGMKGVRIGHAHASADTYPGRILSVGIFTDGVEQVDQMNYDQAVTELLAFKSANGQFFTRRMNRFLQDVRKTGRGPLDDIAGAVIHFEP
jgi:hypothetical protein